MENKYKVVLYQQGVEICKKSFSDIESARNFYYRYDSFDYGIRLYVDNKPLKICEAEKLLGKNPYWAYTINQNALGSDNIDICI